MERTDTRKRRRRGTHRRWVAGAIVAVALVVAAFLVGDFDLATGVWKPFGPQTPYEWPLIAFTAWMMIALGIGFLFGWTSEAGTRDEA
jgi:hypothetical protein